MIRLSDITIRFRKKVSFAMDYESMWLLDLCRLTVFQVNCKLHYTVFLLQINVIMPTKLKDVISFGCFL